MTAFSEVGKVMSHSSDCSRSTVITAEIVNHYANKRLLRTAVQFYLLTIFCTGLVYTYMYQNISYM